MKLIIETLLICGLGVLIGFFLAKPSYPCSYVQVISYEKDVDYVLVKCDANERQGLKENATQHSGS